MKLKIVIKSIFGATLFEYEKEDNTIKDTIEAAVEQNINLEGANLRDTNLMCANLKGACFFSADFSNANLSYANLSGANLGCVNFNTANLYNTDFSNARLYNANFSYAYLDHANLSHANLSDTDFCCASLGNTNLEYANFNCANLYCTFLNNANLYKASLYNANLYESDFSDAINLPSIPMNLPEGEFIAWKSLPNGLIAKLKILEDSKRSRALGNKCRCDKALVLEFQNADGSKSDVTECVNYRYNKCKYKVGEIVHSDSWGENRWNECSHGIHFFLDRELAVRFKVI